MPGQRSRVLDWPYVEGLRMDEAMNPLTLLAVGLYGEVLPNQNGAPIRLVVPWKYGFKSAKSIVKIRFVEKQPLTAWMKATPERVWLLFQRQSAGGPSALEPGQGTSHRRILQARYPDVQWLRRAGCPDVPGHGSEKVFLMRRVLRNPKFWVFAVCLLPLMRLIVLGFSGGLGANPIEFITRSPVPGRWSG